MFRDLSCTAEQPTWEEPKQRCAYIKILLKQCKKEKQKCISYKRALQECKEDPPIFTISGSQGYTMLSGFFMKKNS